MKNKLIFMIYGLLFLVLIYFSYIFAKNKSLASSDLDLNKKIKYQEAVVETAYQYFYRGKVLQYDGTILNYEIGNNRRTRSGALTFYNTPNPRTISENTFYSPEEATSCDIHYLVCSHYVVGVYAETFVQNGKKYTIKKSNGDEGFDTIFLNDAKENYTYQTINSNTELNNCINSTCLEAGDLILRMGTEGNHVMLYVGNGKILHSAGGAPKAYIDAAIKINKYNIPTGNYRHESKVDIIETDTGTLNNADSGGTVLEDCINPNNNQCYNVFGASKSVYVIKIIDSLVSDNTITLSNNAKSRLNAKGFVVDKNVTIGESSNEKTIETIHSVNLNDIINYKITIKNKSNNNYKNVKISEFIPENTTFYSASNECDRNNNIVTCSYNLNANSQKTFYIRVKVNGDRNLLGKTIKSVSGKVKIGENYSIATKNIYTIVNRTLTDSERIKLVNEVYKFKDNDNFSGLANNFVNYIYEKIGYKVNLPAHNVFFNDMSYGNKELITKIFDNNNSTYNTFRNSTLITKVPDVTKLFNLDNVENKNYSNMLVNNAFGGIFITSTREKNSVISRNKTFHNQTLLVGDVLYLYDSNANNDDLNKKGGYLKGKQNAYLYLGDGNFVTMSSNKVIIYDLYDDKNNFDFYFYSPDRSKEVQVDLSNKLLCPNCTKMSRGERLLTSLLGQDAFVIMRPSYSINDSLTKIEIDTLPTKTSYIQNLENLSLKGGKLKLAYGDYGNEIIDLDNELVKISGFNNTKVGKQNVIVEYKGKTTSFNIEIVPKKLEKITLYEMPTKLSYIQNKELFDRSTGSIKLSYNDGTNEIVKISSSNVKISGFDNTKLGKNTVKISYLDKYITIEVNIISEIVKTIEKVEVIKIPVKQTYTVGEKELDLTGGMLKIYYSDKTTENISMTSENVKISGFDNTKVGKKNIIVEYKGKTMSFNIEIVPKKLEKITLYEMPTKLSYIQNKELFDKTTGSIKLSYNDGTNEIVKISSSNVKISGFDNTKLGKNTVKISYLDKYITIEVNIISELVKTIEKMEIEKSPVKHIYTVGEKSIDLTGGMLKIYYSDKTTENISMTSENVKISGFDSEKVGEQRIIISYLEYKTSYFITFVNRIIKSMSITKIPTKTIYNVGDKIDLSDGIITLYYSDDTIENLSMLSPNIDAKIEGSKIYVEYLGKKDQYDIIMNYYDESQQNKKYKDLIVKLIFIFIPIIIIITTVLLIIKRKYKRKLM